jgi:hypothetical protein
MKVTNSAQYNNIVYASLNDQFDKPTMVNGTIPGLSHDSVSLEISNEGRQLAESDIVHHAAKYFGTAQINDSLNQLLENKSSNVKEAVYGLIQSNFITNTGFGSEEERFALIDLGISQAEYIANNYIEESKRSQFMDTMKQIAGIAKTRTMDSSTGEIHYNTPAQRPVGAPEDYIKITDLMRKYEPDTLNKLQDAIATKKDWGSILISFAKKAAANESWRQEFRVDSDKQREEIMQSVSQNRFDTASTSSLTDFTTDIKDMIVNAGFSNNTFLLTNFDNFIRRISGY